MLEPKLVFLIFVSGKIVVTGAKTKSDIDEAFEKLYPVLEEGRKRKLDFL
jgi:transcription initiation factor TFIID TATA-box-binding protein